MNTPDNQTPRTTEDTGSQQPPVWVLIRFGMPDDPISRLGMASIGRSLDNVWCPQIIAVALRKLFNLPPGHAVPMGELARASIFINCGPVPSAHVIQNALELLAEVALDQSAVIMIFDQREGFFREVHRGSHVIGVDMVTPETFLKDLDAARDRLKADGEKLFGLMRLFESLKSFKPPGPPPT